MMSTIAYRQLETAPLSPPMPQPTQPAAAAPTADDVTDLGLARTAAAGDARAFEQLYRRHVRRVYGLCCRLVNGDERKAEQATQDAFVRAWEKLGSFRGDSQFSTWLHRLTVNLVLGEYRLMRRWVSFDDLLVDAAGEAEGEGDAAFGEHPQQHAAA